MRRKAISICSIVLALILLLALGWSIRKGQQEEKDEDMISKIFDSPAAKFEYAGSDEVIYITSDIKTLSNTFASLDVIESKQPVSEWIYRITFNCKELVTNGEEIVVLIGSESLSINGENYSTPEGVPFENVVELFASKYNYFVN